MHHPTPCSISSHLLLFALINSFAGVSLSAGEPIHHADTPNPFVGLASIEITPTKPVYLAGYANRNRPFTHVDAPLFAKAIYFRGKFPSTDLLLITTDLIGLQASVSEPILREIETQLRLKRGQVVINSSHTHTGPLVSLTPDAMYKPTGADLDRTIEYTREVSAKLVELAKQAKESSYPVEISIGSGLANIGVNRREFTPNGVILGVNPRGLIDRSVPVMVIKNCFQEGKPPVAILFGTAVHGTTLDGNHYGVSGDFAGFAQAELQRRFPEAQAMYFLGCAGDTNPHPRGTLEMAKQHGKTLADEVTRVVNSNRLTKICGLGDEGVGTGWVQGIIEVPLDQPANLEEAKARRKSAKGIDGWVYDQTIERLNKGQTLPKTYPVSVTIWKLHGLTWVFLPGEVVGDYVRELEFRLGPNNLWITAYSNDVFGYLPTNRQLIEGGYETRGIYYGGIGKFAPNSEQVVLSGIADLSKQLGIKAEQSTKR